MAEKIISLDQLKMLALRGTADSAARIGKLAELVIAGLENAQHTGITVTLPTAGWSGRVQTIQNKFFVADEHDWYLVCGDADCFMNCSDSGVRADNVTENGKMRFRCEITPEVDLTVNILRLEVES